MMGYAYHELIPAAILLDNPGITKDVFVQKLDQTHFTAGRVNSRARWSTHKHQGYIDDYYHKGLEGLAVVLGLDESNPDFSQQLGSFFRANQFRWKQSDGRYSLDPQTFDVIPLHYFPYNRDDNWAQWRQENEPLPGEFGYSDLLLTAEVIKQQAWKLLSYKGLNHRKNFFNRYPESQQRWEKAITDAEISFYAKRHEMTHQEMLRMRLSGNLI